MSHIFAPTYVVFVLFVFVSDSPCDDLADVTFFMYFSVCLAVPEYLIILLLYLCNLGQVVDWRALLFVVCFLISGYLYF